MDQRELEAIDSILDACLIFRSELKPSQWYESNMIMPQGSAFPGPIKYSRTPFWKEIVDCADQNHPARDITLMGPAQMGKSIMVLNPIVGYTIAENPGNILFLTGHADLTKKAVLKIDSMIDNTGIRKLIKPSIIKARNNRTGDTAMEKEFRGGTMISGAITNHNLLRQNDIMISIADDLDAGQSDKKDTGSTIELIKGRTKAFESKCKRYWVSSPQIKGRSLIESQFEMSDQRYFYIPCEKCHKPITLKLKIETASKEMAGLTWTLDKMGRVDPNTVGYICPLCGEFFTDRNKDIWLNEGIWKPTCEPKEYYHYGYHITGLYAPHGMTSWFTLAEKYQLCHPPGEPVKRGKYQTFLNIDIGDTYEDVTDEVKSTDLMNNIRSYKIGTVPQKLSIKDGNKKIVILTCAFDLNGTEDDARIDWEVIGWSETMSSYHIIHGSIGTFIFGEGQMKYKTDRKKWTYHHNKPNSVWPEVEKVLAMKFETDDGSRPKKIYASGLDTGKYTVHANAFLDHANNAGFLIFGLKGDRDRYIRYTQDLPNYRRSKERQDLYLVEGGQLKDDLANRSKLKFNENIDSVQPPGFINFPSPSDGLYQPKNYFNHYEAEHRVFDLKEGEQVASKWVKKTSAHQNHFFDVRIYNTVTKDIMVDIFCAQFKVKDPTWNDFVNILNKIKK